MNWNKIENEGTEELNLPKFKVTVLLADKNPHTLTSVSIGHLRSIDIEGPHWSTGKGAISNALESIFGSDNANVFHPTHWCEIEMP